MNSAHQDRTGFTLIETLLVITLIAMLSALLFPVLLRARRTAYKPACSSNLRQLGMAIAQYAQDWEERYPTGVDMRGAYFPGGADDLDTKVLQDREKQPLLSDLLHHYAPSREIWRCPSDHGLKGQYATLNAQGAVAVTDSIPSAYETLGTSYEYEGNLAGARYESGCEVGETPEDVVKWGPERAGVLKDVGMDWHGEGSADPNRKSINILYEDGHVAFDSVAVGIAAWVCHP